MDDVSKACVLKTDGRKALTSAQNHMKLKQKLQQH